jgi:hypothetical protein
LLSCFSSFSFFFFLVTIKTLVPTFFFPGLLCLVRIELGLRALPAEKLWAMKLGLKLLAERAKKHSFWWPYIHKLPERFRMPVFFSGDEIQQLQYPPIIHQATTPLSFLTAMPDAPSERDDFSFLFLLYFCLPLGQQFMLVLFVNVELTGEEKM